MLFNFISFLFSPLYTFYAAASISFSAHTRKNKEKIRKKIFEKYEKVYFILSGLILVFSLILFFSFRSKKGKEIINENIKSYMKK